MLTERTGNALFPHTERRRRRQRNVIARRFYRSDLKPVEFRWARRTTRRVVRGLRAARASVLDPRGERSRRVGPRTGPPSGRLVRQVPDDIRPWALPRPMRAGGRWLALLLHKAHTTAEQRRRASVVRGMSSCRFVWRTAARASADDPPRRTGLAAVETRTEPGLGSVTASTTRSKSFAATTWPLHL